MSLTHTLKVVSRERREYAPVPGHDLVMCKIVGHGLQVERVVHENEAYKPGWNTRLRPKSERAWYAVNMNAHMRHEFSRPFEHKVPGHSFHLTFKLKYRAGDARVLVTRLAGDPMQMLCDEIGRVLGGAVSVVPWSDIVNARREDNFTKLGREIYADHQDDLQEFARDSGIELHRVELALSLTGRDMEAAVAETQVEQQELLDRSTDKTAAHNRERKQASEIAEITGQMQVIEERHKLQVQEGRNRNDLRKLEAQGRLIDQVGESGSKALNNIASEVSTPQDLAEAAALLGFEFGPPRGNGQSALRAKVLSDEAGATPALTDATNRSRHCLEELIGEVLQHFGAGMAERGRNRRLLGSALHLAAEVAMGAEAEQNVIDFYKARLDEKPDGITVGQHRLCRKLQDVDELKAKLS